MRTRQRAVPGLVDAEAGQLDLELLAAGLEANRLDPLVEADDLLLPGEVEAGALDAGGELVQLPLGLLDLRVLGGDEEVESFLREDLGELEPDPARGAGYDRERPSLLRAHAGCLP